MSRHEMVMRWCAITDYLADAQVAARITANAALPEPVRRGARARHALAVAALLDELAALRRDGVLDEIEDFLRHRTKE